jgi:F0F1-type ATP synthase assembly protein I
MGERQAPIVCTTVWRELRTIIKFSAYSGLFCAGIVLVVYIWGILMRLWLPASLWTIALFVLAGFGAGFLVILCWQMAISYFVGPRNKDVM